MSKPIRILQVFGKMNRGGAEALIMSIYNSIDRDHMQFDFVVHTSDKCDYDKEIEQLGGTIYRIPRFNVINIFKYIQAWRAFFKMHHKDYKVIHGHMGATAAIYLWLAKQYGLFAIAHSHNTKNTKKNIRYYVYRFFSWPTRNIADHLFGCSDAAGKDRFGKNVLKKHNYKTIKNGINTEKFAFDVGKRQALRTELGIEDRFVIGHIGRFMTQKNHRFILDIFSKVRKINSDAFLLLVGDGSMRADIEDMADILGIKEHVKFAGVRADIPDLLCAMDVFLFPSLWEGLGIVLIEAQANGLVCIASDVVPKEAKVTNLLEYLSLSESSTYWANQVTKATQYKRSENTHKIVAQAGYDIADTIKYLQELYLGAYKRSHKR